MSTAITDRLAEIQRRNAEAEAEKLRVAAEAEAARLAREAEMRRVEAEGKIDQAQRLEGVQLGERINESLGRPTVGEGKRIS